MLRWPAWEHQQAASKQHSQYSVRGLVCALRQLHTRPSATRKHPDNAPVDQGLDKARLLRLCPEPEVDDPVTQRPIGPVYTAPLQHYTTHRDLDKGSSAAATVLEQSALAGSLGITHGQRQQQNEPGWTCSPDEEVLAAAEELRGQQADQQVPTGHGSQQHLHLTQPAAQHGPVEGQQQPCQPPANPQQLHLPGDLPTLLGDNTPEHSSLGPASSSSSNNSTAGPNCSSSSSSRVLGAGSFFSSRSDMLGLLQVRQRQLLVALQAEQLRSRVRYRYGVMEGLLVRIKQPRSFPLVKAMPAAAPSNLEEAQAYQPEELLLFTEDELEEGPGPLVAEGTEGAAAAETGEAAGEQPPAAAAAGTEGPATAGTGKAVGEQPAAAAGVEPDFGSDIELLEQLLEGEGPGQELGLLLDERPGPGGPGAGKQQREEQQQRRQDMNEAWLEWLPEDPSPGQQYRQLFEQENSIASLRPRAQQRVTGSPEMAAVPWAPPAPPAAAAAAAEGPVGTQPGLHAGSSKQRQPPDPTYGLTLDVFVYCIPAQQLKRVLWEMGLPPGCVWLVSRVADADVVLHCLPRPGEKHYQYDAYRAQAKTKGIPFISMRSLTSAELTRWLLPVFGLYAGLVPPEQLRRRHARTKPK